MFYYEDEELLTNSICPHARYFMEQDLANPKVPSSMCSISSIPDNTVAYQTLLRFGRKVNLFDWYQCFSDALNTHSVDASSKAGVHSSTAGEDQTDDLARFLFAVKELQ